MNYIQVIDILGTISFAVSGTSIAMDKKLDPFGIIIIAFTTSIGGGTLRDVLIGHTPVEWLRNATTINVIFATCIFTIFMRKYVQKMQYSLFLFDAFGLGLYSFVGIQKGLEMNFSPGICIALGTITGCFGGVIRDILLNEIPLIFRKEIYASVCILGGVLFFILRSFAIPNEVVQVICILLIVLLRVLVVKYKWSLPMIYDNERV
jgi:uncharacterized membrane protein YeiH